MLKWFSQLWSDIKWAFSDVDSLMEGLPRPEFNADLNLTKQKAAEDLLELRGYCSVHLTKNTLRQERVLYPDYKVSKVWVCRSCNDEAMTKRQADIEAAIEYLKKGRKVGN